MLRKLLLLPYSILSLATGAKSFRDNPFIGSKRLNNLGLHSFRIRLAHKLAWYRRSQMSSCIPHEHRDQFYKNGFIIIPNYLPSESFAVLSKKIFSALAPAREMVQGDTITRRIAIGPGYLKNLPELRALIDDLRWRRLMQYVASFKVEPLYYVQTVVKIAKSGDPDPQTKLHADTFHPTMKAWFFLHDVGEEEGPFQYVPGSHLMTKDRLAWEKFRSLRARDDPDYLSSRGSMRIDPSELAALGLPQPQIFVVAANTLIIADTCGFHARTASQGDNKRIEIWAYSRRNPFLPWLGFDVLSIPGIAERRIEILWKVKDKLRKYVGQPWQDAGVKRPGD